MRDPTEYLRRLRSATPNAWIVTEKILQPDEQLPEEWPLEGTTGYNFLNLANRLFVDPHGEAPLNELYRKFAGEHPSAVRSGLRCCPTGGAGCADPTG